MAAGYNCLLADTEEKHNSVLLTKKTCKLLIFKENKHSGKLRASRWLLKQLVRLPSQCGTRVPEKHKLLNQNSTHQTPAPFVSM